MRIDYISDLHLDFWIGDADRGPRKLDARIKSLSRMMGLGGGDVLLLPGDLGHSFEQNTAFLLRMMELYWEVLLVHGNHDFYLLGSAREKYGWNSWNRIREMKTFCAEQGIRYLDGDVVTIGGTTFGGAGMSWDKTFLERLRGPILDHAVLSLYKRSLNDARFTLMGRDAFDPFKFFEDELRKLRKIKRADVMMSHVGPVTSPDMRERWKFDPITTFFYFDGRVDLERIRPQVWVHGHTHDRVDFQAGDTRIVCNPLGYPGECTDHRVQSFNL